MKTKQQLAALVQNEQRCASATSKLLAMQLLNSLTDNLHIERIRGLPELQESRIALIRAMLNIFSDQNIRAAKEESRCDAVNVSNFVVNVHLKRMAGLFDGLDCKNLHAAGHLVHAIESEGDLRVDLRTECLKPQLELFSHLERVLEHGTVLNAGLKRYIEAVSDEPEYDWNHFARVFAHAASGDLIGATVELVNKTAETLSEVQSDVEYAKDFQDAAVEHLKLLWQIQGHIFSAAKQTKRVLFDALTTLNVTVVVRTIESLENEGCDVSGCIARILADQSCQILEDDELVKLADELSL